MRSFMLARLRSASESASVGRPYLDAEGVSSLTQIFRKLIGGLGSPWAWSLIGAESYFLYTGLPIYSVSPFSSKWFCTSTPLWNAVSYAVFCLKKNTQE